MSNPPLCVLRRRQPRERVAHAVGIEPQDAQRARFQVGAFLERHLWRGPVAYVDLARLVRVLVRAGFNIHEVGDDTLSYAYTVRDWARALEARRGPLAARFGEPAV